MSKQKKEYKYMNEPGGRDRLPHKKRDEKDRRVKFFPKEYIQYCKEL